MANIKEVVDKLTMLPIFVVTTHVHWDHIGGHQYFENIGVTFWRKIGYQRNFRYRTATGEKNLTCRECQFPEEFDLEKYQLFQGDVRVRFLMGNFQSGRTNGASCSCPGHSPGHCCFMKRKGYLYSGDLIYSGCLDIFITDRSEAILAICKKMPSLYI